MLDFDLFTRVIDEAGPSLGRIDFFNYGEAFLHKRAVEMCEYIKATFPHIYLYTSTNGLALNGGAGAAPRALGHRRGDLLDRRRDRRRRYVRYRQRGDFDVALANLRAMADEKRTTRPRRARSSTGATSSSPGTTATRRWTRARQMAAEIGVDRLSWEITDHPEDAFSRRFVPGTPDYERIRHEIWDDNNLGNAIPGAMPRARIDVPALLPGLPLVGAARDGR